MARRPVERLAGHVVLRAVRSVHTEVALEHVAPVRTLAQISLETLEEGPPVRPRGKPAHPDRHPARFLDSHVDPVALHHDGHRLALEALHAPSLLPAAMRFAELRALADRH